MSVWFGLRSSTYCLSERFSPLVVVKRDSAQQFLAALEILPDAFLDHGAERVPDFGERFRLLVAEAFQLRYHAAGDGFADLRELRIVLQHLAGDVERQILAVDHAADEAQIGRQDIGVVGDEDAADIELDLALARLVEQVERLGRRRKQQHRIGLPALGAIMQRHRRLVEGAGDLTDRPACSPPPRVPISAAATARWPN